MELHDGDLNRTLFDSKTQGRWSREWLDAFVCLWYARLFIAVPDTHDLLVNPDDPKERMPFNVPQGTRCPTCGNVLQGKGQRTGDASLDEIASAAWSWILRR